MVNIYIFFRDICEFLRVMEVIYCEYKTIKKEKRKETKKLLLK